MIVIMGCVIFLFCLWAVFSKHFCDGIVAKHLLVFAAIAAVLTTLDPNNLRVAIISPTLLALGIGYWAIKNYRLIRRRLRNIQFL